MHTPPDVRTLRVKDIHVQAEHLPDGTDIRRMIHTRTGHVVAVHQHACGADDTSCIMDELDRPWPDKVMDWLRL